MRTLLALCFLTGCDFRSPEEKLDDAMNAALRPADFDELVNERSATMAVERYTRLVDGINHERGLVLEPVEKAFNANYLLRRTAFSEAFSVMFVGIPGAMEESPISGIPNAFGVGRFFDWRQQSLDTVREELKDPNRLKETYIRFKPAALLIIERSKNRDVIYAYIDNVVVPTFTNPVSQELYALYQMQPEFGGPERFEAQAKAEGFPDHLLLEWRFRRYAEGGDDLVLAYRAIAQDFLLSMAWSRANSFWQDVVGEACDACDKEQREASR